MVDWDLRTTLEGLYAAGNQVAGAAGGHAGAAATGRYAGRRAAAYARNAIEAILVRKQIDDEKARVYAPIGRNGDIGWKELHAGITRVMQVHCGEYKTERMLKKGLWWLGSIRESEAERTFVRNPHELGRYLECQTRLSVGEMIMQASLARKASSRLLGFHRVDYPQMEPRAWWKFITIRLENGKLSVGELPMKYWLLPPYQPSYRANYEKHAGL